MSDAMSSLSDPIPSSYDSGFASGERYGYRVGYERAMKERWQYIEATPEVLEALRIAEAVKRLPDEWTIGHHRGWTGREFLRARWLVIPKPYVYLGEFCFDTLAELAD